ncbi:extracellular solute-binding protein [Cellulomonas sp. KRMCY2]|uniref:sugar ABC transporter substrate-binding protein n=1 Tax=Cellulomonas sp. KRMCY2 TaxID=1304865 RepID=UPI00045E6585|nr:extracellular solute-binding protein [Cellulomonas sp. KRMCY2]
MKRPLGYLVVGLAATLTLTACSGGADEPAGEDGALSATGPITIWYSNNEQEVAWGEQVVAAWNTENPDEKVTAEEIPAGKSSEEVIGAAIAAGNAPCLIYNTAPAAVADFQAQGGLVDLAQFEDGASYIETRSGDSATQFTSSDGGYYQLPWKANPVVVFYNKAVFAEAGLDPENPELATFDDFISTSKAIVDSGAADYGIYPAPSSEFYQSWFDFYPIFAAESQGNQLIEDGEATFMNEAGLATMEFWQTMYTEKLAGQEPYTGDSFTDGVAAMAIAGPWAVASYEGKVDWGTVPVPTSEGTSPEDTYTFDDAKNIGMYTACENQGTAWEFLKYSTSEEQDGLFLEMTGQIPLRADVATAYAEFFDANPAFASWAAQAQHTVAVPNTLNSTEIWQTFRDAWSSAIIFGTGDPTETMQAAADEINSLATD